MSHFSRLTTRVILAALLALLLPAATSADDDANAAAKRTLVLTVVGPDGNPAQAKVSVESDRSAGGPAKLTTDAEGRCRVEYEPATRHLFVQVDGGKATVPMRLLWEAGPESEPLPEQYTLPLEAGTTLGGKVVDDAGEPIVDASVVLHVRAKDPAHPERRADVAFKRVTTGAGGEWSYDRVPAGADDVAVGVYHHRYATTFRGGQNADGFYEMTSFAPADALRDRSAVLTLRRAPLIEGQVFGPDGKPLGGAGAGLGQDRVASNLIPDVKTDAEGRFTLAAAAGAKVILTVRSKGRAPELLQFEMPGEGKQVRVDLQPAQTLTGRVVDGDGKPVRGAWVFVDSWRNCRTIDARIRADAEGRFKWDAAPPDAVGADAEAPGYARARDLVLMPGIENEIVMSR